jgi:hypothetical protein
MPFNVGDIAVLKTTGEKVIVLSSMIYPNQTATSVTVRRAIATKDMGLAHVENVFFDFELETFETQLTREFAEAKQVDELRAKLVAETNTTNAAPAKQVPFLN